MHTRSTKIYKFKLCNKHLKKKNGYTTPYTGSEIDTSDFIFFFKGEFAPGMSHQKGLPHQVYIEKANILYFLRSETACIHILLICILVVIRL